MSKIDFNELNRLVAWLNLASTGEAIDVLSEGLRQVNMGRPTAEKLNRAICAAHWIWEYAKEPSVKVRAAQIMQQLSPPGMGLHEEAVA